MTIVKTPKAYNFRTNLSNITIILSWFVVTLIVINSIDNSTIMKVILFITFIILVAVLFWYSLKRKKGFICPECKAAIPESVKNSGEAGEPIMHYCKKCDILWHTSNIPSS